MTIKAFFLIFVSSLLLALFESTLSPLLPSPWRELRPIWVVIVLCIVLNAPRAALVVATTCGVLLPLFSLDNNFALIRFFIVSGSLFLLSESVLTNRSLYSAIAAVLSARILDYFLATSVSFVGKTLFGWEQMTLSWYSLFLTLCWDAGIMTALFTCVAVFTKRFVSSPFKSSSYDT